MADRLRAVPAWVWLLVIVACSFLLRAWLARGMLGPFIMVDELVYSEMAKSVASDLVFAVRGVPVQGYGAVYPILIAPAYALFDSIPDVYAAVKTINSLVMSLAAVPAYLLARRVVGQWSALLAALLAVTVPSMIYTATVMTENAYYPVFLLAALALVVVLERPSPWRYAGFFAALALAYLTRSQGVVVAAAAVTAPVLLGLFRPGALRATVWAYRWMYGVFAIGALLVVVAQALRGKSLAALLGAYSVVGEAHYDVGRALHFVVYHLAELDLYVGVIPVAAAIVLTARARSLDAPLQVLLAVTISLLAWTTLVVGTFASRFADRIQERNMFAVAPLLLILLLAWIARGAPRPRVLGAAAAAASALLVLAIPFDRFVTTSAVSDTLMLLPWWAIQIHMQISWLGWLAFLGAAGFALLFAVVPRRFALVLPLDRARLLARCLQADLVRALSVRGAAGGRGRAVPGHPRGVTRDWIDRAVPAGSDVAVLWTNGSDRFTVNQNEFFNRRVGQVYYTIAPTPGGIGEKPVAVDPRTGVVRLADGRPLRPGYVLTDGSVEPDGLPVARNLELGMTVWKVQGPLVLARTAVTGIYPNDTWSGPVVTWTRRHCRGGTLAGVPLGRCAAVPGRQHRHGVERQERSRRPERGGDPSRPPDASTGSVQSTVHGFAHGRSERGHPGQHRRPRPRLPLQRVRVQAVRIAFDVSPLSHPPTGIGNYIRGTLGGMLEASGGADEIVAFAPTSIRGPGRIRQALDGLDVEVRTWPVPASHALRTAWSVAGHPVAERLARGLRRSALHRLDVSAAASGRPRDDDPRPRPAPVPALDDETDAGHARAKVRQRSPHVRPDLRQLRLHRGGRDRASSESILRGSVSRRRE